MTDLLIPHPSPSAAGPAGPSGPFRRLDPGGRLPRRVEEARRAQLAPLDLAAARERLQSRGGATYWRSLEELAETPEFGELLDREFPRFASEWPDGVSRRNFLQLAAASLGLAGLTACTRQPIEKIVPYVRQAEEILPGKPVLFATAMALSGVATGLLVESHNGRPTKVEGNPEHPASLGASDAVTQASVLGLYDPDRSQAISQLGNAATWDGPEPADHRRAERPVGLRRRGPPPADRPDQLAHRGAPDRLAARELPAGALAPLGSAGRRHRDEGARGGLRRAGRAALRPRQGRRRPGARVRLPDCRSGLGALRPRLRRSPPGGATAPSR